MKLTLSGNPISTNNLYRHIGNRVYMTQKGKDLKEQYAWEIYSQEKETFDGLVEVEITYYFGNRRKNDIDNFSKVILDSITDAGIWEDDSQIAKMTIIKKYDKENPRIEIQIGGIN